ncbi:MAG: hypothetical protein JST59_02695 [Actinobacteria bacterium]|nr:hypothetical protein [Actinomycetota bacterium]
MLGQTFQRNKNLFLFEFSQILHREKQLIAAQPIEINILAWRDMEALDGRVNVAVLNGDVQRELQFGIEELYFLEAIQSLEVRVISVLAF